MHLSIALEWDRLRWNDRAEDRTETQVATQLGGTLRRTGLSLLESLLVLVLIGILTAMALPPIAAVRNSASVRAALTASVAAFDVARSAALTRGRHAAVRIDTAGARLVVHIAADTLLRVPLGAAWGVRLSATRDSSAFAPDGLGYGAANLSLVIARGAAADSITVSRLGRVARR